jgi:hypothetical protein
MVCQAMIGISGYFTLYLLFFFFICQTPKVNIPKAARVLGSGTDLVSIFGGSV